MLYLLVIVSGFAGLVYEVLWMKQLGLLFGNTSQAAGATLAAFFAGLAAGSFLWGRRAARCGNALRRYAWLELGIAASALLYFVVLRVYHAVYPALYQGADAPVAGVLVKLGLALLLVFPPAFFMGGTIPVMGQFMIRAREAFGRTAALLYGLNTIGAVMGAFLAGFYFPLWLGFRLTCLLAIGLNVAVAAVAFVLARRASSSAPPSPSAVCDGNATETRGAVVRWGVPAVAFVSGFGFLALEVVWTRMFTQVLENSVYTFAAILVIALTCLAAGAFASAGLARRSRAPLRVLAILLALGGMAVVLTPYLFMHVTDGMKIVATRSSWSGYIGMIFHKGFLALGPSALLLGMVFPFMMKVEEHQLRDVGRSLGRLAALNTTGAILGALLCGFVLLPAIGMWGAIQMLAVLYLLAGAVLAHGRGRVMVATRAATVLALVLVFTALNPRALPIVSIDPGRRADEEVLQVWEGSDATVAVTRGRAGLTIKMNSHYGLGATGAYRQEQFQNDLPLTLYPETRSIFFLGMGTGITAGSALDPAFEHVERIVVCELVPDVITAARTYITDVNGRDYTGGLFTDPRATILAEDGRHHLMATQARYDIINGDLFVPFRSGVGSLYTREHFRKARERLRLGGVFVQWVPLYQVTEYEFRVMARTMLEAFDEVSLWRGGFQPGDDVAAFVGHTDGRPLPPAGPDQPAARAAVVSGKSADDLTNLVLPFDASTALFFYCGNLTRAASLFADAAVNTDDRPVIEYMAPRSYRGVTETRIPWFVGPRWARLVEAVQAACPPDEDPLLAHRAPTNRRLPLAGTAYYRARIWQLVGNRTETVRAWRTFVREWTAHGMLFERDAAVEATSP